MWILYIFLVAHIKLYELYLYVHFWEYLTFEGKLLWLFSLSSNMHITVIVIIACQNTDQTNVFIKLVASIDTSNIKQNNLLKYDHRRYLEELHKNCDVTRYYHGLCAVLDLFSRIAVKVSWCLAFYYLLFNKKMHRENFFFNYIQKSSLVCFYVIIFWLKIKEQRIIMYFMTSNCYLYVDNLTYTINC